MYVEYWQLIGKTQGFLFFRHDGATTQHLLGCSFFSDVIRMYFWSIIIVIESHRINALSAVFVQTRIKPEVTSRDTALSMQYVVLYIY